MPEPTSRLLPEPTAVCVDCVTILNLDVTCVPNLVPQLLSEPSYESVVKLVPRLLSEPSVVCELCNYIETSYCCAKSELCARFVALLFLMGLYICTRSASILTNLVQFGQLIILSNMADKFGGAEWQNRIRGCLKLE